MTAIVWIGESFYFVALDSGLKAPVDPEFGIRGEAWQVHGGGFYRIQKYTLAPAYLPADLTWFKWQAYSTWIFGFALLVVVYYLHPSLYLIDPMIANLTAPEAVVIGCASIVIGCITYDTLCRSRIGRSNIALALVGFALLVVSIWCYLHLFSSRGAFLHVGALVGSIMVGNVLFVIIPNQTRIVCALIAEREPDPKLGYQAKQRSLHNNYLTLPVVFVMLSNHYAFVSNNRFAWQILASVFLLGFLIRHYFNMKHAGLAPHWYLWPASSIVTLALVMLTVFGSGVFSKSKVKRNVNFSEVHGIIQKRCQICHSVAPLYPGITQPPRGIVFDTPNEIVKLSWEIYLQAVIAKAMPLNNATGITQKEREVLADWIANGAKGP
jgi:uncharacterized membrane protein